MDRSPITESVFIGMFSPKMKGFLWDEKPEVVSGGFELLMGGV